MIVQTLKSLEPELRAMGVERVRLFGSAARGDAGPDSDIDVAVRWNKPPNADVFLRLSHLERIKRRLSEALQADVDVALEPVDDPRIARAIEEDAICAFSSS